MSMGSCIDVYSDPWFTHQVWFGSTQKCPTYKVDNKQGGTLTIGWHI